MRTLLVTTLLLAACGSDDLDLATPDHCNPVGGTRCMTPWPSAVFEVDDSTTATGRRINVPAGTLPKNIDGIEFDPAPYNRHDGFSSSAPLIAAFETGIDGSNLVHYTNYAASITDASPTVLINMETGELVPHFAELDARVADDPAHQALFIRSAKMLAGGTRYVAAIRKTLKAPGGGELPIAEGFQALIDGTITTHPLLEKVRPRYLEIFAALEAHGIAKTDLVVAWDFTTASRASVRADLLDARTATLAMTGTNGSALDFTSTDMAQGDTRIARRIDGTFDAPLFLTNQTASLSTKLVRDADGKPMATGLYRIPFTAIIPTCALSASAPVPIMIYGHGLMGTGQQAASGGTRAASAEICAVAIGTDMRGMSEMDVPNIVTALNDGNQGHLVFDVLVQGMMNHIALVQIARGPMAQRLFTNNGASIVDPEKVYYYGISQGGIMGTTVCAIDPVIKRCVVQVGAINYSLLLERSRDWPRYRITLNGAYPNGLDVSLMLNLMQQEWDRTEPTAVADVITGEGFPNTPKKQVFMQVAIGDDEVSNVASEYQARTMDIPLVTPSPYIPYGMTTSAGPVPSGMILYDFGVGGTIPPANEAPPDNDVHSNIRNKKATTDMMKRFYESGEIVNLCTAPKGCDCTVAGACGAPI
ncbi:MAG: hypothetical protein JWP01_1189 [Myxococcales bacterium]|nr:hypothetical protein [Myxococcales bacterium]